MHEAVVVTIVSVTDLLRMCDEGAQSKSRISDERLFYFHDYLTTSFFSTRLVSAK